MPRLLLLLLLASYSSTFAQTDEGATVRQQRIREEIEADNLPPLPAGQEAAQRTEIPLGLNIDSENVVKSARAVPNEGKPYFTISGGITPFQVSLGVLKYFMAQWWGQADLSVFFIPSLTYDHYFLALLANDFNPFVGVKLSTGYAFYSFRDFEMSLFGTVQFSFISTVDIPIIFGGGFRFIYRFFWTDLGVIYSLTAGGTESPRFNGVQAYVALGFRF